MRLPRTLARKNQNVRWALIYAFYLLLAIGLIIISAITLKFGNDFFVDPNSPATGAGTTGSNSGSGTSTSKDTDDSGSGGNGNGSGSGSGSGSGAANDPNIAIQRRNAQIKTGVISSVGVALGTVSLVLNLVSFAVQTYLDIAWRNEPLEKSYDFKEGVTWLTCCFNLLLLAGNITLAWGFASTSHTVRTSTVGLGASTPSYLIGACIVASISAIFSALVVVVDVSKCRTALKMVRRHTSAQPADGAAAAAAEDDEKLA